MRRKQRPTEWLVPRLQTDVPLSKHQLCGFSEESQIDSEAAARHRHSATGNVIGLGAARSAVARAGHRSAKVGSPSRQWRWPSEQIGLTTCVGINMWAPESCSLCKTVRDSSLNRPGVVPHMSLHQPGKVPQSTRRLGSSLRSQNCGHPDSRSQSRGKPMERADGEISKPKRMQLPMRGCFHCSAEPFAPHGTSSTGWGSGDGSSDIVSLRGCCLAARGCPR
ncbi:hypothetical protein QBC34DRAFT_189560 [Podospora aff. communis PSN243]|uniref:Uncharacterized protein n=1 Tax=Podospora aff. communis PSN243 TaxID=3040156 RepID=A0AAV9GZ00_9PEZI|nr:hypothetical protein QBC34DRAFT_189560 [Podospora aff. communis PSN243]